MAKRARVKPAGASAPAPEIRRVPIEAIQPHPDNPGKSRITAANIKALAADMAERGQLQPIRLREHPSEAGLFQIIFGERRYRAAVRLKWETLQAIVAPWDDRQTMQAQAAENAQRVDVDPIGTAQHLERLTAAQLPDGSKGLTQGEAGALYGISQGEVANRIRLLRLPAPWRELIRRGELTVKKARCLLPYAAAPKVLDALLADFRDRYRRDYWDERDAAELEGYLRGRVEKLTRPTDGRRKYHCDYPLGDRPRLFKLDDAARAKLHIVQLPIGKRPKKGAARASVEVATDAAAFDKLQKPHLDKLRGQLDQYGRPKKAAKATLVKGPSKQQLEEMTKPQRAKALAEDRKREAVKKAARTKQLHEALERVKLRFLRAAISQKIEPGQTRTAALLPLVLLEIYHHSHQEELLRVALAEVTAQPYKALERWGWREGTTADELTRVWWDRIAPADPPDTSTEGDPADTLERLAAAMVRLAFWPQTPLAKPPFGYFRPADPLLTLSQSLNGLHRGFIYHAAAAYGVTVATAWAEAAHKGPCRRVLQQYLECHDLAELLELAQEVGLGVPARELRKLKKAELVQRILRDHQPKPKSGPSIVGPLLLPAELKDYRKKAKRKAKK